MKSHVRAQADQRVGAQDEVFARRTSVHQRLELSRRRVALGGGQTPEGGVELVEGVVEELTPRAVGLLRPDLAATGRGRPCAATAPPGGRCGCPCSAHGYRSLRRPSPASSRPKLRSLQRLNSAYSSSREHRARGRRSQNSSRPVEVVDVRQDGGDRRLVQDELQRCLADACGPLPGIRACSSFFDPSSSQACGASSWSRASCGGRPARTRVSRRTVPSSRPEACGTRIRTDASLLVGRVREDAARRCPARAGCR